MFRGSLLNSVVGPVMRGPSSSHAAGPYYIARACRELATSGDRVLVEAVVRFDPTGSFAATHETQGSDEGLAAGLLGVEMLDDAYRSALPRARSELGLRIEVMPLGLADHPNCVELDLHTIAGPGGAASGGRSVDRFEAVSTGGGTFEIRSMNGVHLGYRGDRPLEVTNGGRVRTCRAAGYGELAAPPFSLAATSLLEMAEASTGSGGLAGLAERYEAAVLGISRSAARRLAAERLAVLLDSVRSGLAADPAVSQMRFLRPSARVLRDAERPQPLLSPMQQTATAAAVAVMEHDVARGVLAAAPTAGSAGIVPGTLFALADAGLDEDALVDALWVMALVGGSFAWSGTFAAECGGCAVETGAGAAMAAGGLVTASGGTAEQSFEAAALCLMNTLGLVCDPVGGDVEIPCHARNVAGIAHAFAAASAVLGGFHAVLPFDDMVEATVRVGGQLHGDLRCTARGGCAATPTAVRLVTLAARRDVPPA